VVGDHPGGGDPADRVVAPVGEPQRPVGPGGDGGLVDEGRARCSWTTPAVVIRPMELLPLLVNHSAPSGPAVIPTGLEMPGRVVGDHPGGGDPPDGVVAVVGEPQRPVGPHGDVQGADDGGIGVDADRSGRGDPPDHVVAKVGEPQGPVGPRRDVEGDGAARIGVAGDRTGGGDPSHRAEVEVGEPQGAVGAHRDPRGTVDGRVGVVAHHPHLAGAGRAVGAADGGSRPRGSGQDRRPQAGQHHGDRQGHRAGGRVSGHCPPPLGHILRRVVAQSPYSQMTRSGRAGAEGPGGAVAQARCPGSRWPPG
jgi:hypothetical protein